MKGQEGKIEARFTWEETEWRSIDTGAVQCDSGLTKDMSSLVGTMLAHAKM